ncbi:MAG TPA: hypothetical protein VMT00_02120 [Thermoanaerobaculia bacterium]|nr:hypothetical protein [Thermoanaerobaculia bacterium]
MGESRFCSKIVRVAMALSLFALFGNLMAQQEQPPAPAAGEEVLQQNLQEILEEREAPDSYRYDPQGRRDPFRSLIGPTPKLSRENAPPGPPGFLIDEMNLIGIVKGKQGLTAMVRGPDNNGYLLRAGEKVFDGEVIRITPNSVVFRQEVNDPTRIERYREVVKELKAQASGKKR